VMVENRLQCGSDSQVQPRPRSAWT
jgi:hypothetical protein